MKISFSIPLPFFKIIYWFVFLYFGSMVFACYLRFVIWNFHYLNYSMNGYEKVLPLKAKKITNKILNTMMNESTMFQGSMMPDIFSVQG
jgi:hypothetical protein